MGEDEQPEWDQTIADDMIGAVVLIGITYIHPEADTQEQMYGVIDSVDEIDGFGIILSGAREGETYRLPPDLKSFERAPPGDYRLRSTGETVTDPEYISQWTVRAPAN